MNNDSTLTLHINSQVQEQAAALFQSLGMDLSTATGIFYRQALRYRGMPFELSLEEPNEITYTTMKKAENNEDVYGPFDDISSLMEALNA